jgi:hypothetical protein
MPRLSSESEVIYSRFMVGDKIKEKQKAIP